jgi:hypothetical protein
MERFFGGNWFSPNPQVLCYSLRFLGSYLLSNNEIKAKFKLLVDF